MVHDQVDDQSHVPRLDRCQHPVEVGHGAELLHHLAIVANVVSVVGVRRIVVRRQPDHVDAQLLQIVQARRDALQVADPIAVRVLKRARIDLVDDRFFPPLGLVPVDPMRRGGRGSGLLGGCRNTG